MSTNNIDIWGMLQNQLHVGVTIEDAIKELIENALSAESTKIALTIDKITHENKNEYMLILSDDGWGMNKEALDKCGRLHSRTESSAKRHGRFGFGGNQAQITLSNLEGSVIILSHDGTRISQLTTDFRKVKETGNYTFQAHGIESDSQHLWNAYAINPQESGTIILIRLPETNWSKLSDLIIDNQTVDGLRYTLATTYMAQLVNGVEIRVKMNDFKCQIHPFDRLCSSASENIMDRDILYKSRSHTIEIYQTETLGEIVAYVQVSPGSYKSLDNKFKTFVDVEKQTGLTHVGDVDIEMAYCNNWADLQQPDLDLNDITQINKKKRGVADFRKKTNGKEIVRNDKVIVSLVKPAHGKGDTAGLKYHNDTRSRTKFTASEIMDKLFEVQVNKSQLNERSIRLILRQTIDLLVSNFSEESYKLLYPLQLEIDRRTMICDSSTKSISAVGASLSKPVIPRSAGGASSSKPVIPRSAVVHSRSPSITETEVEPSDSVSVSDNESTTDDEVEPAIVATPSEEGHDVTAVQVFVPDSIRPVRGSLHPIVVRAKGEEILAKWMNSDEHVDEFKLVLDNFLTGYLTRCAPHELQLVLNICTNLTLKYNLLIQRIRERHELPEDHMFMGVELLRRYNLAFSYDDEVNL